MTTFSEELEAVCKERDRRMDANSAVFEEMKRRHHDERQTILSELSTIWQDYEKQKSALYDKYRKVADGESGASVAC